MHACLPVFICFENLIRRLTIVINSQQVPLAPLTKSSARTCSALPIPPVLHQLRWTWRDVWFLWKAKGSFSFIHPRGKEQPQKHVTPCLHFSKNYWLSKDFGLKGHLSCSLHIWTDWMLLAAIRRGFLLMPRTSLWSEINFHPPILCFAHCASCKGIYKCKLAITSLGHELG